MKKINKLQLKKSVIAKLAATGMNQAAGGKVNITTVIGTIISEYSQPCSGGTACPSPTDYDCTPTYALCPGTVHRCI